jgi:hypothetical protein
MTLEAGHIVYKGSSKFLYPKVSGTIHANMGCIVEQTVKYKRNKHT